MLDTGHLLQLPDRSYIVIFWHLSIMMAFPSVFIIALPKLAIIIQSPDSLLDSRKNLKAASAYRNLRLIILDFSFQLSRVLTFWEQLIEDYCEIWVKVLRVGPENVLTELHVYTSVDVWFVLLYILQTIVSISACSMLSTISVLFLFLAGCYR